VTIKSKFVQILTASQAETAFEIYTDGIWDEREKPVHDHDNPHGR
jgi:hypothetical protein